MTTTAVKGFIDRIAEEADLTADTVERIWELTAESLSEAAERGEPVALTTRRGDTFPLVLVVTMLAEAEREQTLDPATMRVLKAVRNLVVHGRSIDRVVDALMPDQIAVPTPAAVLQAQRNAVARSALLEEFGALRSHEVAELAGSRAANRAALANRWRAEGKVDAVAVGDELLYPGFQFTPEGRPRPVVGAALRLLRSDPHTTDWQAALWFTTPTGWLAGRRPVDLLDEDPDAVVEAAQREVRDLAG